MKFDGAPEGSEAKDYIGQPEQRTITRLTSLALGDHWYNLTKKQQDSRNSWQILTGRQPGSPEYVGRARVMLLYPHEISHCLRTASVYKSLGEQVIREITQEPQTEPLAFASADFTTFSIERLKGEWWAMLKPDTQADTTSPNVQALISQRVRGASVLAEQTQRQPFTAENDPGIAIPIGSLPTAQAENSNFRNQIIQSVQHTIDTAVEPILPHIPSPRDASDLPSFTLSAPRQYNHY